MYKYEKVLEAMPEGWLFPSEIKRAAKEEFGLGGEAVHSAVRLLYKSGKIVRRKFGNGRGTYQYKKELC